MAEQVRSFIRRFWVLSEHGDIVDVFTSGCCYWFAYILCARFGGVMMYDPVANHFAAGIGGRLYDIRGDVTDAYNASEWAKFADETARKRIEDCCITFVR